MVIEHLVDQAQRSGPLRPHAATGIRQFPRNSFGNEFRETLQRAYISGHADVDLLNTEPSVCACIATVRSRDHIDRSPNRNHPE